jgi:hypothetical protein
VLICFLPPSPFGASAATREKTNSSKTDDHIHFYPSGIAWLALLVRKGILPGAPADLSSKERTLESQGRPVGCPHSLSFPPNLLMSLNPKSIK